MILFPSISREAALDRIARAGLTLEAAFWRSDAELLACDSIGRKTLRFIRREQEIASLKMDLHVSRAVHENAIYFAHHWSSFRDQWSKQDAARNLAVAAQARREIATILASIRDLEG